MPPALSLTGLHHVALATRQPDVITAFYRDVLGFRELERPDFDFRGSWLFNFGLQIHVINSASYQPEEHAAIDTRSSHLAFAVEDASRVTEVLEAHGLPYKQQVNAGGIHQTFFQDPDGRHIELAEYPPTPAFRAG